MSEAASEKEFLEITELTSEFDVTARTLRHYEEVGLLKPRRVGNQRLYSLRDRVRIQLILRGRRLGFSLPEIQEMLDLYDADPTEVTQLHEVIQRGEAKSRQLEAQIAELREIITELQELSARMKHRLAVITSREDKR
ncbi:MAG: MerR family transcriptional regulator [Ferrimicrobium sp.]